MFNISSLVMSVVADRLERSRPMRHEDWQDLFMRAVHVVSVQFAASGRRFTLDAQLLRDTSVVGWLLETVARLTGLDEQSLALFIRLPDSKVMIPMAEGLRMLEADSSLVYAAAPMGVLQLFVVLRLRSGKGGFGKQLVRTGRMYASAKRRMARTGGNSNNAKRAPAQLSRNLQGEMNEAPADGSAASRRQRIDRRVAAAEESAAQEEQRQIARERLTRLEQETAVVTALQTAVGAGFARLMRHVASARQQQNPNPRTAVKPDGCNPSS